MSIGMNSLNIERVDNGFIITYSLDGREMVDVYRADSPGTREHTEEVISMLYFILDYFGERGSKHDEHRVSVMDHKDEKY